MAGDETMWVYQAESNEYVLATTSSGGSVAYNFMQASLHLNGMLSYLRKFRV